MVTIVEFGVVYFPIPPSVLRLNSKLSILAALALYRDGGPQGLGKLFETRYRQRQTTDVQYDLVSKNVLTEDSARLELKWHELLRPDRIVMPRDFDYESLSFGALKAYIACNQLCRYQRKKSAFRFTCTQEEFAQAAHLSRPHLRKAVKELSEVNLIKVTTEHKKPATYTMLDPGGSGVECYYLAESSWSVWGKMETWEKYNVMFPALDLGGDVTTIAIRCIFCKKDKAMRVTTTDDKYRCFACGVHGSSDKFFAKWTCANMYDQWMKHYMPLVVAPEYFEGEEL
jgi:hypothetical protein